MNLVPAVLSQILSSNFHIRTYVEATLIKLHVMLTKPYPSIKNGINHLTENPPIKTLTKQLYSIIRPILNEWVKQNCLFFRGIKSIKYLFLKQWEALSDNSESLLFSIQRCWGLLYRSYLLSLSVLVSHAWRGASESTLLFVNRFRQRGPRAHRCWL